MTPQFDAFIRLSLRGYRHHGSRFWPAAVAFMLLALRRDDEGDLRPNATLICPGCVKKVADTALSVIETRDQGDYPPRAPGGAVELVGPAPLYDLIGVSELPFCAGCAECRSHIGCSSGCSDCRSPDCPCRCRTVGHTPTEALICAVCDADLRSSDTEAIKEEVATAIHEGRIIGDGCARAIAAHWFGNVYDGLVTHGYLFVSTGAIPPDLRDVWELLKITDWSASDTSHPKHRELVALGRYLKHHGPRGPVEGWARVWIGR